MVETRRLTELIGSVSPRLRLPHGDLVVALSGGADSASLAYLCVSEGRHPRALHVNHGLANSELMEKAATNIADTLGLPLEVANVEVPDGPSPEGQARRARYGAFADSTSREETLLTAHTRDDDVETILLNLIRGTGPRGLAGIPYFRPPNIVRPMLAIDRSESREIAGLAGLGFVDDPMNDDPGLTRNLLRHQIIPSLHQINPRLSDSLIRMAAAVASDNEYLDSLTAANEISLREEGASYPIGSLLASPRPVADRILMRMLAHVLDTASISSDRVGLLWSVVGGEIESHELGEGTVARRRGPLLVIEGVNPDRDDLPVVLTPGLHRQGLVDFEVIEVAEPCRVIPLSRWAAVFPSGSELTVRPDGVVTSDGEPVWVPGERRLPTAWYEPGTIGYLSVFARENTG